MKILESYTSMIKQFIISEREEQDKDKKVYKTKSGKWAGDYDGDIEYFDDAEKARHWSKKGDMEFGDSKDDEDSAGKLGGSDFERDGGDEPKSEPKSEPKDTTGSIAGNEDAIDFAQALAQGNETNRSYQGLKDAGHEDLAKAISNADSEEEKFDLVRKASEEPDEPKGDEEPKKLSSDEIDKKVDDLGKEIFSIYNSGMSPQDQERYIDDIQKQIDDLKSQKESIKVINGKKYKAVKESKEHIFKKAYKRIGGK
tara:strand:- start:2331 stop:3095 length:765 start_codon:yes stop_codon:yes gene_type:complete